MNIKFFYPDEEGNIKFTREQLEKVLNDVFDEGRSCGRSEMTRWMMGEKESTYIPVYYNTPHTPSSNYTKVYCTNEDSIGRIILDEEVI